MPATTSAVLGTAILGDAALGASNHDASIAVTTAPQVRTGTFAPPPTFTVSSTSTSLGAPVRVVAQANAQATSTPAYSAVLGQALLGAAVLADRLLSEGPAPLTVNAVAAFVRTGGALSATSSATVTPSSGQISVHANAPAITLAETAPAAPVRVRSRAPSVSATATATAPSAAARLNSNRVTATAGIFVTSSTAIVRIGSRTAAASSSTTRSTGSVVRIRGTRLGMQLTQPAPAAVVRVRANAAGTTGAMPFFTLMPGRVRTSQLTGIVQPQQEEALV